MTDEIRPPYGGTPEDSGSGPSTPTEGQPPSPPTGSPATPGYGASAGGFTSDLWDGWFGRLLMPAIESKGWLRFLGVVLIASGILAVLSIFGILVAWLYIWLGVLLWQAADRAQQATQMREPMMLEQYMQKIKTVIVISGVTTAVSLVLSIFGFILMFAFGWAATWMEMMDM